MERLLALVEAERKRGIVGLRRSLREVMMAETAAETWARRAA